MNTQYYTDTSQLPQPFAKPIVSANYKAVPTDFIVEEIMDNIECTGVGEHLWLEVKKTGMNTAYIAKELAKWAGIPQRDVGYSGLKDRHAVTTQWFSLRIPKSEFPTTEFSVNEKTHNNYEEAVILQQHWHSKKLNKGTHKFNRFTITLKNVVGDLSTIEQILKDIQINGVPNYFGEQRFGRDGNNLRKALHLFELDVSKQSSDKRRKGRKDRDTESLLLSAARSVIFNQILAMRVNQQTWNTAIDGEIFNLAGTGSVFNSESITDELIERTASMDIHPTASLWGVDSRDKDIEDNPVLNLEKQLIADSEILTKLAQGLESKGIKKSRRPLRLVIKELTWQTDTDNQNLTLTFLLPSGSFATSVLQALAQELKQ